MLRTSFAALTLLFASCSVPADQAAASGNPSMNASLARDECPRTPEGITEPDQPIAGFEVITSGIGASSTVTILYIERDMQAEPSTCRELARYRDGLTGAVEAPVVALGQEGNIDSITPDRVAVLAFEGGRNRIHIRTGQTDWPPETRFLVTIRPPE